MDPLEEYSEGLSLGKERDKSGVTKPLKQGSVLCILWGRMLNMTVVSFSVRYQHTTAHFFLCGLQVISFPTQENICS